VQGVTFALARAGFRVGGFSAWIDSDVPLGSGVSSSAALEVAMLRALREANHLDLDDVRIARLGQEAENDLVGAPVGIMDQMCASLADQHAALLLDCRSLEHERIALPRGADLVVINSGVTHRLAAGDSGYATRRSQCEEAARLLGVSSLRDLAAGDLPRAMALPEPLGRRVRHVVNENARVLEAAAALRSGDVDAAGRLFVASHASMRDDYEVSAPEVDLLVAIAAADADVHGARLTGGGFGGSIVALARAGAGADVAARVSAAYAAQSGQTPTVLVPATSPAHAGMRDA
jgi:galactokinase